MKSSVRGGAGIWFLILLLGLVLWVGFRVGGLYFDHASLEKEIKTLALDAMTSTRPPNFEEQLMRALDRYRAEFDPEHISIRTRNEGTRMAIRIPYWRVLDLGVTQKRMGFEVDVEQDAPRRGGVIHESQQKVEDAYGESARRYEDSVKKAFSNE